MLAMPAARANMERAPEEYLWSLLNQKKVYFALMVLKETETNFMLRMKYCSISCRERNLVPWHRFCKARNRCLCRSHITMSISPVHSSLAPHLVLMVTLSPVL